MPKPTTSPPRSMLTPPKLVDAIRRARANVNTFARLCFTDSLGRRLQPAEVHRELQAFLTAHPRALVELPRDHGKSVQVCVRLVWELGRRPGLRVKVVCATRELAAERGRFLRDAIAENPCVRLVFPHLKPARPWEESRFTVRRRGTVVGPTVAALGIGAHSTGARADLLVCDDVVDVQALRSRADRERVKQAFRENLVNLLEPDGRLWYVFTPWHGDDLSAELKQTGVYGHLRRPIGPDLEPVWPAQWPRERLAQRRREIGEVAFARAYRLVCVTDGAVAIRPAWVRTWHQPTPMERVILAVDPAASTSERADRTAVVALGQTAAGAVHCLEAAARRLAAPELVRWLESADRQWQPDDIVFEANAGFLALAAMLASHAGFGAKVRPIRHSRDKAARIAAFGVHVEAGRFLIQGDAAGAADPGQQELFDEMTTFPLGEHDDLVDAAAFGAAYLLDRRLPRVF
jgi:predicted phage terminase large subunit-like protein